MIASESSRDADRQWSADRLLDRRNRHHGACTAAARHVFSGTMLTTWPCFTEAMHLLGRTGGRADGRTGGWRFQATLWALRASGRLVLHDLTDSEADRMEALMDRYSDTPMDLADASLVTVAESRSLRRVFTTDGHFRIYRLGDGSALEMVPSR